MRIIGVAIGALMIGGVVIALSGNASASNDSTIPIKGCMNPKSTNYDESATEDDGSCQFTKIEDQQDYTEELEEAKRKAEADAETVRQQLLKSSCSGYSKQSSKYREFMSLTTSSVSNGYTLTHDIEKLKVNLGVAKTKYVVGEPIIIYQIKSVYSNDSKDDGWVPWGTADVKRGEKVSLNFSVKSNDETILLGNFSQSNASLPPNNYNPLSGNSAKEYSFRQISIPTSELNITEPTKFKVSSNISLNDGHKTKSSSKESVFTIYPKSCGEYSLGSESAFAGEEFRSSQSYIDNWW